MQISAHTGPFPSWRSGLSAVVLNLFGWAMLASASWAQSPSLVTFQPGNTALDLSSSASSSLGLDLGYLEDLLCNKAGVAQCGLTVDKVASDPALVLTLLSVRVAPDKGGWVDALPSKLALAGTDLATSCGLWRYQITLDPQAQQETSQLHLSRPTSLRAPTGPFTGTVTLAARIHFESLGAPVTVDLPETLTLEMAGQWTGILDSQLVPPGDSNVVLLVENALGTWGSSPTLIAGSGSSPEIRCNHRLWLQSPRSPVDILNTLRPR